MEKQIEYVTATELTELKEYANELIERYKQAKADNDTAALASLQEEWEEFQTLSRSNVVHFKKIKNRNLRKQIKQAKEEQEKNDLLAKKEQKKEYKDNKYFTKDVEKSDTLQDYIKKNKRKKWNFVRKHFAKAALGLSLIAVGLGGYNGVKKLTNNNKNDKEITTNAASNTWSDIFGKINDKMNANISVEDEEVEEILEEDEYEATKLSKWEGQGYTTKTTDDLERAKTQHPGANVYQDDNGNVVIEEAQNPGVNENEQPAQTTEETVLQEEPAQEPAEEEYKPTEEQNSEENNNQNENNSIEEKDPGSSEENTNENGPVQEDTNSNDNDSNTNNSDSNSSDSSDNSNSTQSEDQTINTIIEVDPGSSEENTNTDGIEIEEDVDQNDNQQQEDPTHDNQQQEDIEIPTEEKNTIIIIEEDPAEVNNSIKLPIEETNTESTTIDVTNDSNVSQNVTNDSNASNEENKEEVNTIIEVELTDEEIASGAYDWIIEETDEIEEINEMTSTPSDAMTLTYEM